MRRLSAQPPSLLLQVGKFSFMANSRARAVDDTEGMVRSQRASRAGAACRACLASAAGTGAGGPGPLPGTWLRARSWPEPQHGARCQQHPAQLLESPRRLGRRARLLATAPPPPYSTLRPSYPRTPAQVKIIADAKTDKILGAHIMGPNAGELIPELVLGME
jgi:hypothetical protein